MRPAVIAFIPKNNALDQSIGCVIPIKKELKLGKLLRLCNRIANDRMHARVSINMIGNHTDFHGLYISIAFHLATSRRPVADYELNHRANLIRNWIQREFRVHDFCERTFPSRAEFCNYMRDPTTVM